MPTALRLAGLLALLAVVPAWGQTPAEKKGDAAKADAKAPATNWSVLFRSDDPSLWDKNAKNDDGEQVAIPVKYAPDDVHYLRLRRMDTGDYLILPITTYMLKNSRPADPEADFWWNGSAKDEWKGRHLGIVQGPRYKFPAPNGLIGVMTEGWDLFVGSGFGHKCAANDHQHYCWKGHEIPKTEFEIAVTEGPLTPDEKKCLVGKP